MSLPITPSSPRLSIGVRAGDVEGFSRGAVGLAGGTTLVAQDASASDAKASPANFIKRLSHYRAPDAPPLPSL
jgi:hypothetical protein